MPTLKWTLTVADVVAETADAATIVFDSPDGVETAYRAGQFLTLRVPSELAGFVARCYSLCSSPATDKRLAVTVKRTADGYASNWLCDNVRVGDQIECLPPAGVFTPADLDTDLAADRRRQRNRPNALDRHDNIGARSWTSGADLCQS